MIITFKLEIYDVRIQKLPKATKKKKFNKLSNFKKKFNTVNCYAP